eukprot:m.341615 g.341615  ORF g.341615 m.341615 type:complete len:165 (-) comp20260_c0_seq1:1140-1634(-)
MSLDNDAHESTDHSTQVSSSLAELLGPPPANPALPTSSVEQLERKLARIEGKKVRKSTGKQSSKDILEGLQEKTNELIPNDLRQGPPSEIARESFSSSSSSSSSCSSEESQEDIIETEGASCFLCCFPGERRKIKRKKKWDKVNAMLAGPPIGERTPLLLEDED